MNEGRSRRQTGSYNSKTRTRTAPFWLALVVAALLVFATTVVAQAATTGGVTSSGGVGSSSSGGSSGGNKYSRRWKKFSRSTKRWAHRTSRCESGENPKAVSPGGRYRGAFQFSRPTWRRAPKSPKGDPIKYSWTTQAVVAVYLKRRDGRSQWPVCG